MSETIGMQTIDMQKVKIDPIGCYKQAFDLVQGQYWVLLAVSAVGMMIGGSVPIVLIGPMMCGIYLCFLEKYDGREFAFELLFKGFDFFVPSLIASLIMTGITMLALIPVFMVVFIGMFASISAMQADGGQTAAPALFSLGIVLVVSLLSVALILVVSMFFLFTFPLIVDRKLDGVDAIRVSAKAVAGNFAGVLGLTLIGTVLAVVSVLACYVGTFFVMPISMAAMTIAYRKVFPEIEAQLP